MNIFEIDISYINNNYSSVDTFFIGLTHAFSLALPISLPLLICLRRLLVQGIPAGIFSYLGTVVGQTLFISLILFGCRDFVQVWYDWEPTLYILGVILSFHILFQFYNDTRLKLLNPIHFTELINIFIQSFILVFLNPVNAINTSRFITTQEIIGLDTTFIYLTALFIGLFGFSCLFGFLFYLMRNWFLALSLRPYLAFMRPINKGIVILCISLVLSVTAKFTWQLFLQHPAESLLSNIESVEGFLPVEFPKNQGIRKFPGFDTNIRNRDRHLPVHRHFPLDSLKMRRFWANKPPLTESQTETVYFRYNVHILNKLSDWVEKVKFTARTPFSDKATPEQIKRLKQIKTDYLTLQSSLIKPEGSKRNLEGTPPENKGKGEPTYSYAQERFIKNDSGKNIYLHVGIENELPSKSNQDLEFFLLPSQFVFKD